MINLLGVKPRGHGLAENKSQRRRGRNGLPLKMEGDFGRWYIDGKLIGWEFGSQVKLVGGGF